MWLWGSRPHLEEQVLCLPSLWQPCSQSQPPWGWSSLFPSHPDLEAHFLASLCCWVVLNQWCLQARLWTIPVCIHFQCWCGQGEGQPSLPVSCSGCPPRWLWSHLGPGDGLGALGNVLYVQPLVVGSCTTSLCTTWRRMFVCFPFILLPAASLWWLLSRKRWLDHALCAFSVIQDLCVSPIIVHLSAFMFQGTCFSLSLLHCSELYAN